MNQKKITREDITPLYKIDANEFKAKTLIYLNQLIDILIVSSVTQSELRSLQHILQSYVDTVKQSRLKLAGKLPESFQ